VRLRWRVILMVVLAASTPASGRAQSESTSAADVVGRLTQDSESQRATDEPNLSKRRIRTAEPPRWEPLLVWRRDAMVATLFALIAALVLSIPVALVYRYTSAPGDFDPSIAQSILILPATVAGIIIVVQGSLALAFSLAGVVTAVRFRSSLKDTNDATFIFLAVAIGVAAGARALDIAVVVTAVVCLAMLVANRKQFVLCLPHGHSAPPPHADDESGNDAHVCRVIVHQSTDDARRAVEGVLTTQAKSFILSDATPDTTGGERLVYAARVRKKVDIGSFRASLDAVAKPSGATVEVLPGPAA
jgi:uncharacterized membrane protein YhiD involved in acid resistance